MFELLSTAELFDKLQAIQQELRRRQEQSHFPDVIIVCEGGLVQDVISDLSINVVVADYDIEGAAPEEITNDFAVCSIRTPTTMAFIDPNLAETLQIFQKEMSSGKS